MSLAVTFGDMSDPNSVSGAIYFSAVTSYDRKYRGKVTNHPMEAGVSITDHYISDNPHYQIRGVVSSVDFSNIPSIITLDGQTPINSDAPPPPVFVNSSGVALQSLIPDAIQQILPNISSPSVVMSPAERDNKRFEIESLLKELMSGLYFNEARGKWENRMTLSKVFSIEGITPSPPLEDLVILEVSVDEGESTGDELFLNLTLEQVRFASLESADAPKPPPKSDTAKKTEPKKDTGSVSPEPPTQAKTTRETLYDILRELVDLLSGGS